MKLIYWQKILKIRVFSKILNFVYRQWSITARAIRTWCRGSTSRCLQTTGCPCMVEWIYHKFHQINKCVRIQLMPKNYRSSNQRITLLEHASSKLKNLLQKRVRRMVLVSLLMLKGRSRSNTVTFSSSSIISSETSSILWLRRLTIPQLSLWKTVKVKDKKPKRRMRMRSKNLKRRILKKTKLKQLPRMPKTITQTKLTLGQPLMRKRTTKKFRLMKELKKKLTKNTVYLNKTKMRNS